MPRDWLSIPTVIKEFFKSLREVPGLAWVALISGILGLFAAGFQPAPELPRSAQPCISADGHPCPLPAPKPAVGALQAFKNLPWWELLREISLAAVVSFFLALFLDAPLRERTIAKLGRDVAPFLISALTVPEMRYKMRQICEFAVIRRESRMLLWVLDDVPGKYRLKIQMRSKFCNISNAKQSIPARVVVDEETNGSIIGLFLRPVNLQGVREQQWSCAEEPQPESVDGQRAVKLETDFPSCDDWEHSYIEVTGEYEETVTMIGNVGRTLFESYWPLMGVEIECVKRPPDIELKIRIPYHSDLEQIGKADRWVSSVALLPGERVDIILRKTADAPAATQTVLVTQQANQQKAGGQRKPDAPAVREGGPTVEGVASSPAVKPSTAKQETSAAPQVPKEPPTPTAQWHPAKEQATAKEEETPNGPQAHTGAPPQAAQQQPVEQQEDPKA
jgi:hypothetical protein